MEDNRDDMKEFFRKKLNQQGEGSDGWDIPSPRAFDNAMLKLGLSDTNPQRQIYHKLAYACLPALFFFAAYSVYLNIQLHSFKSGSNSISTQEETNKQESIKKLETEIATLKNDLQRAEESIEVCHSNKRTSTPVNEQIMSLHNIDAIQSKNLAATILASPPLYNPPVAAKSQSAQASNMQGGSISEETHKRKSNTIPLDLSLVPLLVSDIPALPQKINRSFTFTEPVFIKGTKLKKRKGFDYLLGMEYGHSRLKEVFETEIIHTEEESEIDIDEVQISGQSLGISFAFSPFKNVWLRTGLHSGSLNFSREYSWRFFYLDENNVIDNPDELINLLRFSTSNRIASVENELYTLIGEPDEIEFGDILFFGGAEFMKYRMYQIPLSMAYDLPLNKISLSPEIGLRWQSSRLVEYDVEGEFSMEDERAEISSFESSFHEMEDISPLNEFTYFGGLGIKYDISRRCLLHANIQLELGNAKSRIDDQGLFSPKGRRLGLGLYYKL